MLALMYSQKLAEEGFDVPLKPALDGTIAPKGLSLGYVPEGVKTGLDDFGQEVQYTHAAGLNYFDGGATGGFTVSDDISQHFPDTKQVATVNMERMVKDQQGNAVNQDKWAAWGYNPVQTPRQHLEF